MGGLVRTALYACGVLLLVNFASCRKTKGSKSTIAPYKPTTKGTKGTPAEKTLSAKWSTVTCHQVSGTCSSSCGRGKVELHGIGGCITGVCCVDKDEGPCKGYCGGNCLSSKYVDKYCTQKGYVALNESVCVDSSKTCCVPSSTKAECSNKDHCGPPPVVANAETSSTLSSAHGSVLRYQCKSGFADKAESSRFYRYKHRGAYYCRDGAWISYMPINCQQICQKPPTLANAVVSGAPLSAANIFQDDTVTYSCKTGYAQNGGSAIRTCTNGAWKGSDIVCLRPCGPPPVVANAETSSTLSSAHGSVLRYQCKSGFVDKAEPSRYYRYRGAYYCRDGAWIGYMPINCQQICQKPPTVANAVVSGAPLTAANIFQDDTVTYSCKTGYAQNGGSAIRTCTNGAWKGSDIVCLQICQKPPTVANAVVSGTPLTAANIFQDDTVTYSCKTGYAPNGGSAVRTCTNGAWEGKDIVCQRICQKPPTVANAVVSGAPLTAANIFQDDTVTYTCKTGYAQNGGSAVRTCTNGAWKGSDIVCQQICQKPPTVANAIVSGAPLSAANIFQDDTVTYSCKTGYAPKGGSAVRTCTNGAWKGSDIVCQQICQKPPTVANAVVSGAPLTAANIFQHDKVTYWCKTGYAQNGGSAVRTCSNGAWKGSDIVCQQICQKPPTVANAVVSGAPLSAANIFQDDTLTYSCKTGYAQNGGSAVRTCTNGAWKGKDIVCQQICQKPPTVANAVVSGAPLSAANIFQDDTVTYSCKTGYAQNGGSAVRTCTNGAWKGKDIVCQQICQKPPTVANSVVSGAPLSAAYIFQDDTVTYSCKTGYAQNGGSAIRTCTNGAWKGTDIVCLQRCPEPPTFIHATLVNNKTYVEGDQAVYVCNKGYINKDGLRTLTCVSEKWDGKGIKCTKICPQPPLYQFAQMVENASAIYSSGDSVNYKCSKGYEPSNPINVMCTDGFWVNPSNKTCKRACPTPPSIPDTTISPQIGKSVPTEGDAFTYSCASGFVSTGSEQTHVKTCRDGKWTQGSIQFQCKRTCPSPPKFNNTNLLSSPSATYVEGKTVTYRCQKGHQHSKDPAEIHLMTCSDSGVWKGSTFICKRTCTPPPSVQNTNVVMPVLPIVEGSSAYYICKGNSVQAGGSSIKTCVGGSWEGVDIICEKFCSGLPYAENADTLIDHFPDGKLKEGARIIHRCKIGYIKAEGDDTRTCTNGTWSGKTFKCEMITTRVTSPKPVSTAQMKTTTTPKTVETTDTGSGAIANDALVEEYLLG
ncbi:sushi, von Willebrand factor type A, EGF and pentraxin domain-containing protein 1 isoform X2 [Lingula anatina]|uniref:Sushi, von Willebrand factor type A, EGF and pentraxin domain-containing protein 1 isoform X2 n=1 Tax=Lingula anatina TaxID=7574 RepID=A0A1S3J4C6_LINAN|nr:sushi, von Willebrand factor type A, EGF and pentraxin domain-containing protein 1 isoform X2 [Lingula anatina]|eukprot:XP_013405292.1 sushi, von Willebrand factor type A, EGF and pentraxin domain-containing protein 1 isoform X2 [Lingula anatina]